MQVYSDFRVNCYPQTVIDLVTCFCKQGCIAHCSICKPLVKFCTLLCKCKWHASCLKGALYRIQILCRRYTLWSYPAGLTIAEESPSLFTPLSPSLFTPHQILYSAPLIQQLLERQYKLVDKCTKSVEIGTAPFTSSAFAMAIIGLKGENRTY